jgi:hypothetical protein
LLSSGVLFSKMVNGLLLQVHHWWIGCNSWMLAGTVGSLDVVGVLLGLLTGNGLLAWHAMARVALGDGLSIGTLVSSTLGPAEVVNLDRSTLGVGVFSGVVMPGHSVGRKMLQSLARVPEMESLAEVGTVPPRAVRMSIALRRVRSACMIDGAVQWVGYRRHVLATWYLWCPECRIVGSGNVLMPDPCSMHLCHAVPS